MTITAIRQSHVRNPRALFIGGAWIEPSSSSTIDVVDSTTEEVFLTVAEAQALDVERAVAAARTAFDEGPWARMTPAERGVFLHKIADAWETRSEALADTWASESGTLRSMSIHSAKAWRQYSATMPPWAKPSPGRKSTPLPWASRLCSSASRWAWLRPSFLGTRRMR